MANPTRRVSAVPISTYATRADGTTNRRPLSSTRLSVPAESFNADATSDSISSGVWSLFSTSSRAVSATPTLTSTLTSASFNR